MHETTISGLPYVRYMKKIPGANYAIQPGDYNFDSYYIVFYVKKMSWDSTSLKNETNYDYE